jgi:hypothetical protein
MKPKRYKICQDNLLARVEEGEVYFTVDDILKCLNGLRPPKQKEAAFVGLARRNLSKDGFHFASVNKNYDPDSPPESVEETDDCIPTGSGNRLFALVYVSDQSLLLERWHRKRYGRQYAGTKYMGTDAQDMGRKKLIPSSAIAEQSQELLNASVGDYAADMIAKRVIKLLGLQR